MRKFTCSKSKEVVMIGKLCILLAGILLALIGLAGQSDAGVDVNVGIFAPPPAYVVPAPPPVVVIPGSYVYLVPGIDVDILFYHGYWWRPYQGHWYRSKSYNGPWGYYKNVPRAIMALPPDYRRMPPGSERKKKGIGISTKKDMITERVMTTERATIMGTAMVMITGKDTEETDIEDGDG